MALSGCAATPQYDANEIAKGWVGQTEDKLKTQLGNPTQLVRLSDPSTVIYRYDIPHEIHGDGVLVPTTSVGQVVVPGQSYASTTNTSLTVMPGPASSVVCTLALTVKNGMVTEGRALGVC
jgi:hypothetical protein